MEIQSCRQACQSLRNIPCTRNNQARLRTQYLEKDLKCCTTATYSLALVGIHVNMRDIRTSITYCSCPLFCHFPVRDLSRKTSFVPAIGIHEHLATNSTGSGTHRFDHGGERDPLATPL